MDMWITRKRELPHIPTAQQQQLFPHDVRDLGLSAGELGFASSAFFFSSIIIQLPYGVLLDRLDPRKLYACCLLLCALGAILSAFANDVYTLSFGRALVAVGAATGAVTSFKINSMWYEPKRLPMVNGMTMAAGGLGLMMGTAPVEAVLYIVDWRDVHLIIAGFLLIAAVLILIIVPVKQSESAGFTLLQQIKSFAVILKSLLFWRAAPLTMGVVGTYAGISTLWSGPWLRDVAGISGAATANILLFLAAAFVLSGLLTGWLTSLVKRLGLTPMGFVACTAGLFGLVLVGLFLQWTHSATVILITWVLFGFLAPLNFFTYAVLGSQFPKELGGRLNACLTLAWMLGAYLFQSIYGLVLNEFPSTNGSYAVEGHRLGLGIIILFLIAAFVWFLASSLILKMRPRRVVQE